MSSSSSLILKLLRKNVLDMPKIQSVRKNPILIPIPVKIAPQIVSMFINQPYQKVKSTTSKKTKQSTQRAVRGTSDFLPELPDTSEVVVQLSAEKEPLAEEISRMERGRIRFIAFYCKRLAIAKPIVSFLPSTAKKGSLVWTCVHSLKLSPDDKEDTKIAVSKSNKKVAEVACIHKVFSVLVNMSDVSTLTLYLGVSKPIRKVFEETLREPLKFFNVDEKHLQENFMPIISKFGVVQKQRRETLDTLPIVKDHFISPADYTPLQSKNIKLNQGGGSKWSIFTPPCLNLALPISKMYHKLTSEIEKNQVVIIAAETGAGKTTQLPQFLLKHFQYSKRTHESIVDKPNIIVSQPRRIAAMSIATRVAEEMKEKLGNSVGYAVRFDTVMPKPNAENGNILFCTCGVLIKKVQGDPSLKGITHIILDEVHERDVNTDILLILIRRILWTKRPDLKLILMSATADTQLFQKYFTRPDQPPSESMLDQPPPSSFPFFPRIAIASSPPIVSVSGKCFEVTETYLEDMLPILKKNISVKHDLESCAKVSKHITSELGFISFGSLRPTLKNSEKMQDVLLPELPIKLLEAFISHTCVNNDKGAILVFLPGAVEITELGKNLLADRHKIGFRDQSKFRIFPLHSNVPMAQQSEVFNKVPPGCRKIVLATNIAETSITINDIVYVIDAGRLRVNEFDPVRKTNSLNSIYSSLSNTKQRIGRAGRVQRGHYLSILSRNRKTTLPYAIEPELHRVDLQQTILMLKSMYPLLKTTQILSAAPQPPNHQQVETAISSLVALNALEDTIDGQQLDLGAERLTNLGRALSSFPTSPSVSRLIFQGVMFKCLDPILSIAAWMGKGRSLFQIPRTIEGEEKMEIREMVKREFSGGNESDQLMMTNAFRRVIESGPKGSRERAAFCERYYINMNSVHAMAKERAQFYALLEGHGYLKDNTTERKNERSGIINDGFQEEEDFDENIETKYFQGNWDDRNAGGPYFNKNSNNTKLLLGLITGSLYPNFAQIRGPGVYTSCSNEVRSKKGSGENPSDFRRRPWMENLFITSDTVNKYRSLLRGDIGNENDEDILKKTLNNKPTRILVFQEKQNVDGRLFMRNTSRADLLSIGLFSNAHIKKNIWDEKKFWIDNWMEVDSGPAEVVFIEGIRKLIRQYEDDFFGSNGRYSKSRDDFIQELVRIIDENN